MITQAQIKSWLPDTISSFTAKYPVSVPSIRIASRMCAEKVRDQAYIDVGLSNPSSPRSLTAAGETIHGPKGSIIVIFQANCPVVHDDFERFLWHELGHTFVFSEEADDFFPKYCFGHPENRISIGYLFWEEFVAEALAYSIRGEEVYLDVTHPLIWPKIYITLQGLLEAGISGDYRSLAYFFATSLMDKKSSQFLAIIERMRLQEPLESVESSSEGIRPIEVNADITHLDSIYALLQSQLENSKWWLVNERFLPKLGRRLKQITISSSTCRHTAEWNTQRRFSP